MGTAGATFKLVSDMGIYDTPLFVVVTSLSGFGVNFLMMYGFFNSISWSYAEAVFIDGGGHFTVFFKIMLPLAFMPMLTIAIISFIGCWNVFSCCSDTIMKNFTMGGLKG